MTDSGDMLTLNDVLVKDLEPKLRVAFVLSPFFSMLSFSAFVDILRLAGDTADRSQMNLCHWTVVADTQDNICASSGIEIAPKKLITEVSYDEFDYIVVVGGILRGSYQLAPTLGKFIQGAAEHGLPIVGICTGSFIMAGLGLLDGYRCSIHFQHFNEFTKKYSAPLPISDQTYIIDGGRYTSIGGAAPAYLAAELVKTHCGPLLARKALKLVILDYGNDEKSKTHIGNQFADIVLQVNDVRVRRAVVIMEKTIAEPLEIREIAEQLNVTMRQLNKAFMDSLNVTPSDFYRDMRIRHAEWLLTNSSLSITLISQECGFADSAHLTRWFKRKYNESPKHYRHRREEAIHIQKD